MAHYRAMRNHLFVIRFELSSRCLRDMYKVGNYRPNVTERGQVGPPSPDLGRLLGLWGRATER